MAERRGGVGGRGGWEVGEWRRAETSVWDANNTRRLGAQQGDDGDDDNNNSTMTTTMRSWARAGGGVVVGEEMVGMFCVVRLCDELLMQRQRQGKAGTSSAASRSPRGRQIPRPKMITDCSHWPFLHVFYSIIDCRSMRPSACIITLHGTAQTLLLLLLFSSKCFLYTPDRLIHVPNMHRR